MWNLLYCCVTLAIANPLWVQALPVNTISDEININHLDIKPLECSENEFFNSEGKACERTCDLSVPQDPCNETNVAACQCNNGYVRNEAGVCVIFSECYENLNVSYNVEHNTSKPISDEVKIEESIPTLNEIQSTNKINDILDTPIVIEHVETRLIYSDLNSKYDEEDNYYLLF